jgi:CHAT domain-containing protein
VRQLGQNLWRNLIPGEFKRLYAAERDRWRDRSLLVFSDEPHLPWELIWPYDESGGWKDDGPWCQTLLVTRWLRKDAQGNGNEAPPLRLTMQALAVVAPRYSLLPNLAAAGLERDLLVALATRHRLRDVSPSQPSWQAVMDLLEAGTFDWLHAAAHGNFYPQAPDSDSALWLDRDQALTPDAIVGPEVEGHLRRERPAFFFNACQIGRQGWALTRIGGWANRLVSGGASLFVGPLWEVSDDGALRFAEGFYTALMNQKTVAEATRDGRNAARAAGDPTWAAYSVYAHPHARLGDAAV